MPILKDEKEKLSTEFKDIIVIPLDCKKLSEEIDSSIKKEAEKAGDSSFAPKIKEGEKFYTCSGGLALIKGTNILIDNECVGDVCEDGKAHLEIYSDFYTDGKKTGFSMFPKFTTDPDLNQIVKDFAMEEISIVEFMGSRFAYNPRIVNNMKEIKKEISAQNKKR